MDAEQMDTKVDMDLLGSSPYDITNTFYAIEQPESKVELLTDEIIKVEIDPLDILTDSITNKESGSSACEVMNKAEVNYKTRGKSQSWRKYS